MLSTTVRFSRLLCESGCVRPVCSVYATGSLSSSGGSGPPTTSLSTSLLYATARRSSTFRPPVVRHDLYHVQASAFSTSALSLGPWRITMDEEQKKKKEAEIEKLKKESAPKGLFAKIKYYCKRYWYIAIPVHAVGSLLWFGGIFAAVKSGIDVIALLEYIHSPEYLLEKVRQIPKGAGVLVITLLLYKVASPLRYATTIAGIQLAFSTLRRMGKLKTAKEVEYKMRTEYEKGMTRLGRRYHKYSSMGVRAVKKRSDDAGLPKKAADDIPPSRKPAEGKRRPDDSRRRSDDRKLS